MDLESLVYCAVRFSLSPIAVCLFGGGGRTGEAVAQQIRVIAALLEDPALISRTDLVAHNHL